MGILPRDTTAVSGSKVVTTFSFFFGYSHRNFFSIMIYRNDINLYGGRQSVLHLSFRCDMSNNQIKYHQRSVRLSRGQPCLLDLYQRSWMSISRHTRTRRPNKTNDPTSPSTISSVKRPESSSSESKTLAGPT